MKATQDLVGRRVRIDMSVARASMPKDGWGLLSPEGVRLTRLLEHIVDTTRFRPFVTEVREDDVEIATSFYGDALKCIRVPRDAIRGTVEGRGASVLSAPSGEVMVEGDEPGDRA